MINPSERIFNRSQQDQRSEFQRDYGRLLHSPSFRRLQGKTQLIPAADNDFSRNRLTHSLEVHQIAQSLASVLESRDKLISDPFVLGLACLGHDIGHPPFGHQGEQELNCLMLECGGFEGNAQTFRILARNEKTIDSLQYKETHRLGSNDVKLANPRIGLNLTALSLASVLKYDYEIPLSQGKSGQADKCLDNGIEPTKGYYSADREIVDWLKGWLVDTGASAQALKTIECSIMDVSDDIAYCTFDLEDLFKARITTPFDLLNLEERVVNAVVASYNKARIKDQHIANTNVLEAVKLFAEFAQFGVEEDNFQQFMQEVRLGNSRKVVENHSFRSAMSSQMIKYLIGKVEVVREPGNQWSEIRFSEDVRQFVEILKKCVYHVAINTPRFRHHEFRGRKIIRDIFEVLTQQHNLNLLPEDVQQELSSVGSVDVEYKRVICDFIANMTDRYCVEFHNRMFGSNDLLFGKQI